jgi:hypothetical protein
MNANRALRPSRPGLAPLAALLCLLLLPQPVAACRYSVRDTGFVDLGAEPYRLELAAPADFAATAQLYRAAAAGLFLEANVSFAPAATGAGTLRLSDSTGRGLDLVPSGSLPTERTAIAQLLGSVATSPRREDIYREALRAYAVIVFVEGTSAGDNERVRRIIQAASDGLARLMPAMPKPVDVPPQLVTIPLDQQAAEAVLIWGLGLEPRLSPEPRVALIYGRGRRLGTPLEGPLITRTALQERLSLIGQDCECELDRAWLKGPVLPGRWDRELQQLAARTLGFDPENPLVRAEVSRIVLRGEGDQTRQKKTSTALALGYSEESVDAITAAPEAADETTATAPSIAPTSPAPPTPKANSPGPLATVSVRPLWFALFGFLAAAFGAGLMVLRRSRRS